MGAKELYRKGDFDVRLDTTLSVGGAVRVQERDSDLVYDSDGTGTQGTATNPEYLNRDDGNQNYDQWDVYSANAKALLELDMRWKNYGAFMRANMFYDVVQNCAHCTQRTDLSADARHRPENLEGGVVGTHFLLLDAYLDGQWEVLDRPFELRVGRQVINWGQSVFIQGGVNQTNAIDVAKVRTPGVDFGREALFPAGFVKGSAEIIRNLGIEMYYQWEWNKTYLDPTGAYFSQSDTTGRGAEGLFFGSTPDLRDQGLPFGPQPVGDPGSNSTITRVPPAGPLIILPGCQPCDAQGLFDNLAGIPQASDDEPDSQGQWGAALRYFLEPIQSEIAGYYVHYHSKTPSPARASTRRSSTPPSGSSFRTGRMTPWSSIPAMSSGTSSPRMAVCSFQVASPSGSTGSPASSAGRSRATVSTFSDPATASWDAWSSGCGPTPSPSSPTRPW
jgi:hypothetical protein